MKQIDFVYFNAGGGHRSAALALEQIIREQQRPWRVNLLNLSDVIDPQGGFRKLLGVSLEDFYNLRLRTGWTIGLAQELKLLQGLIKLMHKPMLKALAQHWAHTEPDMVVSLVPNFNRVMMHAARSALPGVPYVTVMTDLADHPPHFWIEPAQSGYVVCGTEHAHAQALRAGVAAEHALLTTGMVLKPAFCRPLAADRDDRQRRLGLDPQRPTGVVLFGGHGSQQMLRIAELLGDVQLILMCGRNEQLAQRLRKMPRAAPHAVFGFTDDVCNTLRLGDFLIGKPGPGCLSEAVHLGLPVITFLNSATMPQERYNAQWVQDSGVGLVVSSPRHLPAAVGQLVQDLPRHWAATRRLHNRAVHEVPQILADIFATHGLLQGPPALALDRQPAQRLSAIGAGAMSPE
jgi:UDP-N-acetylglucosamine:LPS N-acetylglucosamine transferase